MKDEKNALQPKDLRDRTKIFALSVIRTYTRLPKVDVVQIIAKQFVRSGTSVGAHYREACRARSNAEFISKLEGALQELDETAYWIELLNESALVTLDSLPKLLTEIDQLIRILVTMVKKTKDR